MARLRIIPRPHPLSWGPWMRLLLSLTLVALLQPPLALASDRQSCDTEFLYPNIGATFDYMDYVNVSYTSTYAKPTLNTWCQDVEGNEPVNKNKIVDLNGYAAWVLVRLAFKSPGKCWFHLDAMDNRCERNSPPFVINDAQGKSVTWGLDNPTNGRLPPATTTAAAPASVQTASDPNAADSHPPGLSTGAIVGLAVGVAILVGLLAGGLAAFIWLRRKNKREQDQNQSIGGNPAYQGRRDEKPHPLLHRNTDLSGAYMTDEAVSPVDSSRHDESFHYASAELLPGFYGSARESGSGDKGYKGPPVLASKTSESLQLAQTKHQWNMPYYDPLGTPPHQPATPALSYRAAGTPVEYYPALDKTFHPGEQVVVPQTTTINVPDAELPGREAHRGYGEQYEMSSTMRPPPPPTSLGHGHDVQEQHKFLLQDMELIGLKPPRPPTAK